MSVRTRAALRLAAWLLATVALLLVAGAVVRAGRLGTLTGYVAFDAALLLVSFAAWRILDGRRPGDTPLAPGRRSALRFLRGAALGALLVGLLVAVLALAGAYELAPRACGAEPLLRFLGWAAAFVLLAALFEEGLFRGYGLFALEDLAGPAAAVFVTGLLFAAAHQSNPGFGPLALLNLTLVGAILAVWVLRERDIWIAVGAHAGWNAAIVAGAAIPVSGVTLPFPCHAGIVSGPEWLTGGVFGLEAGVPTAIAWLGLAWWLRRSGPRGERELGPDVPPG
jgi:hypothetical protein